jgi:dual specificity tyrosine-phosphorylation-regulated kinase 2/3/4
VNYTEIYFVGADAEKIRPDPDISHKGYDEDNGNYRIVFGDHIAYRYEALRILGTGSFGQVLEAKDHKTKDHVAIKIIKNKQRFHKQA